MNAVFALDRKFISAEIYDGFFAVVERLEAVLDRETAQLGARNYGELVELTRQKRQGFLELNRILRALQDTIPSQDILSRLTVFRQRLAANEAQLKRQLQAIQEVTDIIVRVVREHESDGTYSRAHGCADWED